MNVRPAAALALALLASGCSRRPARVVFGIAVTSGDKEGALQAAREIDEKEGGVGGAPLELRFLDPTVQEPAPAEELLAASRRFADESALLGVIGPSDSAATLTMAAVLNRRGVPEIVTIATNPAITRIGPYTYRICLSDAVQGPTLATYAVRDWGKRRIALFFVSDDYGRGLAQTFEEKVRALGGEVVWAMPHHNLLAPEEVEQVRAAVARLAADRPRPDLLVLFQRFDAARATLRAIRDFFPDADVLAGDNLSAPSFLGSQATLVEGMRVSEFFHPDAGSAATRRFLESWKRSHSGLPDYGQAFAYDAVRLLRRAVLEGRYSREGVRRCLDRWVRDGTPLEGVAGSFRLGLDHDARRTLHIAACRGGKAILLRTLRAE